jgi:signal transduction histidine kinase
VYTLPTEVENNLLRIGQEALTNAISHAHADEIRVELVYDRDRLITFALELPFGSHTLLAHFGLTF